MGTIKFFSIAVLLAVTIHYALLRYEVRRMARDFHLQTYKPGSYLLAANLVLSISSILVIAFIL